MNIRKKTSLNVTLIYFVFVDQLFLSRNLITITSC